MTLSRGGGIGVPKAAEPRKFRSKAAEPPKNTPKAAAAAKNVKSHSRLLTCGYVGMWVKITTVTNKFIAVYALRRVSGVSF